jgi:hypothetical protein
MSEKTSHQSAAEITVDKEEQDKRPASSSTAQFSDV